jgi:hypothetical protein
VQVVVLLLLVAGLALLVLGLITGSTPLVLASIAASLLAAGAIVRYRRRQEAGVGAAPAGEARDGAQVPARAPVLAGVAGEPAQGAAPVAPAAAPAAQVAASAAEVAVPPAHAVEPKHLAGSMDPARSEDPAEPPDAAEAEPAEAHTDPPLRSRGDEPVWVIDGRPRYHLPGCAFLLGRGPEPVPLRQAVEDGFTPCALCDPDSGLAAGRRPASAG